MKKAAICLSVITLLFNGLAGCGDVDNTNVEGQQYGRDGNLTGYNAGGPDGTGMGGAGYGRGADGRESELYGTRNAGRGQNQMRPFEGTRQNQRGMGMARGITGNDRDGMVDSNGLINGRMRGFNRDGGNGLFGGNAFDRNNRGMTQNQGANGYFDSEDGQLARRIEERVENIDGVTESDVIVHDDSVVIGIQSQDNNGRLESKVRSAANKLSDDKQIHVVTDRTGVDRINEMEGRLRAGEPFEEIGATFNAMLDDLGDAIQRPFERTR